MRYIVAAMKTIGRNQDDPSHAVPRSAGTPAEAREKARRTLGEIDSGRDPTRERMATLVQFAERWLEERVELKRKPVTLNGGVARTTRAILRRSRRSRAPKILVVKEKRGTVIIKQKTVVVIKEKSDPTGPNCIWSGPYSRGLDRRYGIWRCPANHVR